MVLWISVHEAWYRTYKLLGGDQTALITDHIQAGRVPARGYDWGGTLRPVTPGTVDQITCGSGTIWLRRPHVYSTLEMWMLTRAALDWSLLEPLVQPEIVPAWQRSLPDGPKAPLPEAELRAFLVQLRDDRGRDLSQELCWAEVKAQFPGQVTRDRVRKMHPGVFGRQRSGRRIRIQSGRRR
jgi:hypothetical protein